MIEFEIKSKKQHISVNIRDRPKTNTVCRQWSRWLDHQLQGQVCTATAIHQGQSQDIRFAIQRCGQYRLCQWQRL